MSTEGYSCVVTDRERTWLRRMASSTAPEEWAAARHAHEILIFLDGDFVPTETALQWWVRARRTAPTEPVRTVLYSKETIHAYGAVIDAGLRSSESEVLESLRHLMQMVHSDLTGELRQPHTHAGAAEK